MEGRALVEAADRVAEEFRRHAEVLLADRNDVGTIVRHGEALRNAILEYGSILGQTTGWSSPVRLLHEDDDSDETESPDSTVAAWDSGTLWMQVYAQYYIRVDDRAALCEYVRVRLGFDTQDPVAALQKMFEVDGWKPEGYPKGVANVDDIGVDVYIEETGP